MNPKIEQVFSDIWRDANRSKDWYRAFDNLAAVSEMASALEQYKLANDAHTLAMVAFTRQQLEKNKEDA